MSFQSSMEALLRGGEIAGCSGFDHRRRVAEKNGFSSEISKVFPSGLHFLLCFQLESGCLLQSLPSDVTFDKTSGITFLCDLNDNIPAPCPPHFSCQLLAIKL